MIQKFILLLLVSFSLFTKDKNYLTFGAGVHDILRERRRCAEFLVEYKLKNNIAKIIHPFFGAMITTKKYFYGYPISFRHIQIHGRFSC